MKKLKRVGKIIKIVLEIFSIIGILILLFLYSITKVIGIHYDLFIIFIYPCGVCFLYLVYEFIKLFDSLENNKPFCKDNIKRFKISMHLSFIISLLILIALVICNYVYNYYSLQLKVALIFMSFLFFCFSVCFYVLSELFRQANKYKEENDLTI